MYASRSPARDRDDEPDVDTDDGAGHRARGRTDDSAVIVERALRLSERTVEKVIRAIFLKLGLAWETAVHKRVKAVVFYLSGTAAETRSAERSN